MFSAPALLDRLHGLRLGRPLHVFAQLGSTNDHARELAEAGAPEGTLVLAEEQTAGRGRGGRRWLTPAGSALAFSLILRPPWPARHGARLSMLAGLAVCDALGQTAGLTAALKWPNDVLLNGRKTAGLLVESVLEGERLAYAVIGLGLNVSWAPPAEDVSFPATCVDYAAGRTIDRASLLRAVLAALEARYTLPEALFAEWRARLAWLGAPIVVHTAAGPEAGTAVDVTPEGALLVQLETGERRSFLAGEVSLRAG